MNVIESLVYMFIFPGFLFLTSYAFFAQYLDRKLYARFQKRKILVQKRVSFRFFQSFY